jgi:DNA-binding NtrC family response regulator
MNPSSTLSSMKILLVESNEWVRDSLSLAFEKTGCTTKAVDFAEKAIKALRKEHFDIIISDFRLPEYDGLAFFNLTNIFPQDCLKVLISTGVSKDMINESKAAGVHEVIEKPFAFKKLIDTLNVLIDQR